MKRKGKRKKRLHNFSYSTSLLKLPMLLGSHKAWYFCSMKRVSSATFLRAFFSHVHCSTQDEYLKVEIK